jgi:hypothetical protein
MKNLRLAFLALACLGCGFRGAKSPDDAHLRLAAAVAAQDATKLWNALDQTTRWSWMTVQRAWRECYDITQSAVPEGPERTRLLERFTPGATSENAEALFRKMLTPEDWAAARTLIEAAGPRKPALTSAGETAEIETEKGRLIYRKPRNRSWGWGYAGLSARAEVLMRTASADLERMRRDAADYERAATRGAK